MTDMDSFLGERWPKLEKGSLPGQGHTFACQHVLRSTYRCCLGDETEKIESECVEPQRGTTLARVLNREELPGLRLRIASPSTLFVSGQKLSLYPDAVRDCNRRTALGMCAGRELPNPKMNPCRAGLVV